MRKVIDNSIPIRTEVQNVEAEATPFVQKNVSMLPAQGVNNRKQDKLVDLDQVDARIFQWKNQNEAKSRVADYELRENFYTALENIPNFGINKPHEFDTNDFGFCGMYSCEVPVIMKRNENLQRYDSEISVPSIASFDSNFTEKLAQVRRTRLKKLLENEFGYSSGVVDSNQTLGAASTATPAPAPAPRKKRQCAYIPSGYETDLVDFQKSNECMFDA